MRGKPHADQQAVAYLIRIKGNHPRLCSIRRFPYKGSSVNYPAYADQLPEEEPDKEPRRVVLRTNTIVVSGSRMRNPFVSVREKPKTPLPSCEAHA